MNEIDSFLNRKAINIDISFRCPLECPRCARQTLYRNLNKKVPGKDMTLDEIDKLSNHFNLINFSGQLSDPVQHPQFPKILEMLYKKKVSCDVRNAASSKSLEYYIKCFRANPNARWTFGIDGLPEESCFYRINQDGVKLFNIMCESKKYLNTTPTWQYILFSYNEKSLTLAKELAIKNNLKFMLIHSERWQGKDDPYRPKSL